MKQTMLKLDMFKKQPKLRFTNSDSSRTKMGVCGTLFVLIIILFSAIFFGQQMFEKREPEIITKESTNFDPPQINFTPTQYPFAFGIMHFEFDDWSFFLDPRLYTVKIYQQIYGISQSGGEASSSRQQLNSTVCKLEQNFQSNEVRDFESFQFIDFDNLYCVALGQDPQVHGNFDVQDYTTMTIVFQKCQRSKSPTGQPVIEYDEDGQTIIDGCFTDEQIQQMLKQFYVYVYYTNTKIDLSSNDQPFGKIMPSYWTYGSFDKKRWVQLSYQEVQINSDDGVILESWNQVNLFTLDKTREIEMSQIDDAFFQITFEPSYSQNIVYRRYQKFQQVIAEIGGFAQISMMAIYFLIAAYVNNQFYQEFVNRVFFFQKINQRQSQALTTIVLNEPPSDGKGEEQLQNSKLIPTNDKDPTPSINLNENVVKMQPEMHKLYQIVSSRQNQETAIDNEQKLTQKSRRTGFSIDTYESDEDYERQLKLRNFLTQSTKQRKFTSKQKNGDIRMSNGQNNNCSISMGRPQQQSQSNSIQGFALDDQFNDSILECNSAMSKRHRTPSIFKREINQNISKYQENEVEQQNTGHNPDKKIFLNQKDINLVVNDQIKQNGHKPPFEDNKLDRSNQIFNLNQQPIDMAKSKYQPIKDSTFQNYRGKGSDLSQFPKSERKAQEKQLQAEKKETLSFLFETFDSQIQMSFFEKLFFPLFSKKQTQKKWVEAQKFIQEKIDIVFIMNQLLEIDKLQMILLNERELKLFNFIPKVQILEEEIDGQQVFTQSTLIQDQQPIEEQCLEAFDSFYDISQFEESQSIIQQKLINLIDDDIKQVFESAAKFLLKEEAERSDESGSRQSSFDQFQQFVVDDFEEKKINDKPTQVQMNHFSLPNKSFPQNSISIDVSNAKYQNIDEIEFQLEIDSQE